MNLARLALLAVFCGFVGQAQAQDAPILSQIEDADERSRVAGLIEQAREEGALDLIGNFIEQAHAAALIEDFKEFYGLPDLQVEYTYEGALQIPQKIIELLQADRNTFDIVSTVGWDWYTDLLEAGELMEYHSPSYEDYTLSDSAGVSKDGYWVANSYAFTPLYNPKALADRGITDFNPTTWAELNDPKLKGMITIGNPGSPSSGATYAFLVKEFGEAWLRDFAKNVEPVINMRNSQARDWVASGEVPIALFSHAKTANALLEGNVDVKLIYPEEGTLLLPNTSAILAKAPHPAAAKLFIDHLHSARGTQVLMDEGALMLFGRPGVKSPNPDILPGLENINVAKFDWDVDGTAEKLDNARRILAEQGLQ
jgi:iron(III) transport system substrate-binding protein